LRRRRRKQKKREWRVRKGKGKRRREKRKQKRSECRTIRREGFYSTIRHFVGFRDGIGRKIGRKKG
jgi:hypothetical protein